MHAMVLREQRKPLERAEVPMPERREGELLIRVECCAVCRTDLHVVDGDLHHPKLPLVPGHQIVGIDVESGRRVGVPWLGWTCGTCSYCSAGKENLCENAEFTGYTRDGGFAEYVVADKRFCFAIPKEYEAEEAAPLLCAGLIGFRAWRFAGDARRIAFYGFGSAAQIAVQMARAEGREIFAFTREGDAAAQSFAREMGAIWAGSVSERSPRNFDAAVIFAPAGEVVVEALRAVRRGAPVVCAGIHMSDIPAFPYELLWGERSIRSVANLTRQDGEDFFRTIAPLNIKTRRKRYPLEKANDALLDLRRGALIGTAVLAP
ncbi:MAG TPA: zinc-dependent alcohol dehydrogenase family protein [Thermoanaerobaculia bacterium]|nr:zinc-dependent alcohol dehydrogenase family protein [Thermoanaerobaculia bacterium]